MDVLGGVRLFSGQLAYRAVRILVVDEILIEGIPVKFALLSERNIAKEK